MIRQSTQSTPLQNCEPFMHKRGNIALISGIYLFPPITVKKEKGNETKRKVILTVTDLILPNASGTTLFFRVFVHAFFFLQPSDC